MGDSLEPLLEIVVLTGATSNQTTTDTGATSDQQILEPQDEDDRYWSHKRQEIPERQILEPRTTTDTGEPHAINRYWWSHERQEILEPQVGHQILEPQATTNGATNNDRYWLDETGATTTGAMNDRRYRRSVVCGSSSSLQYLLLQPVAPVSSFVVRGSSLQYLSSCCLCNTPLLLRVKSRTANNCASPSGRHTAVHVS